MVPPAATAADAPPDWPTLSTDLTCPLCGYNLRGLADPRCPECGFAFRWGELLDAKRDGHPWLFEHGRGRSVRTFIATYIRTPMPRRFWRAVTPANPVHPGRLVAYWLVASLPLLAIVVAPVPGRVVWLANRNLAVRARYAGQLAAAPHNLGPTPRAMAVFEAQLNADYPAPWSPAFAREVGSAIDVSITVTPDRVAAAVAAIAWPWLSVAALMVFQASLRRAKIDPAHVVRAAVYGCDFGLLMCVIAAVVFSPAQTYTWWTSGLSYPRFRQGPFLVSALPSGPFAPRDVPLLIVVAACTTVATYRLSVAYARYLRFPRPVLVVAASQVIVLLTVMVALSWTVRLF